MAKKKRIIEGIEIVDIGAKGMVIGKKDGIAYLTKDAVPGDIVTIESRRKKKGMPFGMVTEITKKSELRVEPACEHFEHCGGCSWQNLDYQDQIRFKEQRVFEQIRRIAGLEDFEKRPILGSKAIYHYRNKLEFTFVESRWLTPKEISSADEIDDRRAVGFHVPGRFDWVLHVDECHLLNSAHNEMRNYLYEKAKLLEIPFYHPRDKHGILRNVLFRTNKANDWMVLLVVSEHSDQVKNLTTLFLEKFPETKSFWIITNEKVNDSFSDCPAELVHGEDQLIERFTRIDGSEVKYLIGPKSFFQTNTHQAERLYEIVARMADIQEGDVVFDLYTGTGSIALFAAHKAKKVVGVEYVPEAIEDAKKNAQLNNLENTAFFAGDMKEVLVDAFIEELGKPDVLITDPPRAGMHADVIDCILNAEPMRIVYVSCDPATQARDLGLLSSKYKLVASQPVDMFPHTSHVENVALLERL
ncbi:MAG: 23S rRNA (uracil(1939)-C(5))-methyltransferase RlmD [Salibacteraceae bacterium]